MAKPTKKRGPKAGGRTGEKDPFEAPPWKRMAKAISIALLIDLVFLAALLVPVAGFVITLMVGPYTGALIGGKWLQRNRRIEWLGSAIYVALIWPSVLTAIIIGVIDWIGTFDLELDLIGGTIIGMLYIVVLLFTALGFRQGSIVVEEEVAAAADVMEEEGIVLEKEEKVKGETEAEAAKDLKDEEMPKDLPKKARPGKGGKA